MADQTSILASIIQGESATPAGQLAVLNVMQNRAAVNFGGYGTSVFDQAIAPKQFSAYPNALQTPSDYSMALAADANNPGDYQNLVPNSLNYANPVAVTNPNSWVWGAVNSGQGVKIGGNTFWANSQGGCATGFAATT